MRSIGLWGKKTHTNRRVGKSCPLVGGGDKDHDICFYCSAVSSCENRPKNHLGEPRVCNHGHETESVNWRCFYDQGSLLRWVLMSSLVLESTGKQWGWSGINTTKIPTLTLYQDVHTLVTFKIVCSWDQTSAGSWVRYWKYGCASSGHYLLSFPHRHRPYRGDITPDWKRELNDIQVTSNLAMNKISQHRRLNSRVVNLQHSEDGLLLLQVRRK